MCRCRRLAIVGGAVGAVVYVAVWMMICRRLGLMRVSLMWNLLRLSAIDLSVSVILGQWRLYRTVIVLLCRLSVSLMAVFGGVAVTLRWSVLVVVVELVRMRVMRAVINRPRTPRCMKSPFMDWLG